MGVRESQVGRGPRFCSDSRMLEPQVHPCPQPRGHKTATVMNSACAPVADAWILAAELSFASPPFTGEKAKAGRPQSNSRLKAMPWGDSNPKE